MRILLCNDCTVIEYFWLRMWEPLIFAASISAVFRRHRQFLLVIIIDPDNCRQGVLNLYLLHYKKGNTLPLGRQLLKVHVHLVSLFFPPLDTGAWLMWQLVQRSTVWNIACYHVYLQDSHVRCLVCQLVLNAGLYSLHGAFIHRRNRTSLYLQFKGITTWCISYIVPERCLYQSTALSYCIHFHLCWQYWKLLSFKEQSFMFTDVESVFHLCGRHHYTETILALW